MVVDVDNSARGARGEVLVAARDRRCLQAAFVLPSIDALPRLSDIENINLAFAACNC